MADSRHPNTWNWGPLTGAGSEPCALTHHVELQKHPSTSDAPPSTSSSLVPTRSTTAESKHIANPGLAKCCRSNIRALSAANWDLTLATGGRCGSPRHTMAEGSATRAAAVNAALPASATPARFHNCVLPSATPPGSQCKWLLKALANLPQRGCHRETP